jgi:hypothetical protein
LGELTVIRVRPCATSSVWARVTALAEELERLGDMADQLDHYLPEPLAGWSGHDTG